MQRIQIVASHSNGEPTRVVGSGGPNLGSASVAEKLRRFREKYDRLRSANSVLASP